MFPSIQTRLEWLGPGKLDWYVAMDFPYFCWLLTVTHLLNKVIWEVQLSHGVDGQNPFRPSTHRPFGCIKHGPERVGYTTSYQPQLVQDFGDQQYHGWSLERNALKLKPCMFGFHVSSLNLLSPSYHNHLCKRFNSHMYYLLNHGMPLGTPGGG